MNHLLTRHTDHTTGYAVEIIHGVEVKLINFETRRVVSRKVFTGLDDKRDARAFFNAQVAALRTDPRFARTK